MGRENTIRTGSTISKGFTRPTSMSNFYSSNKTSIIDPYEYGVVTDVDSSTKNIVFEPLKDNITYTKSGMASPFYKNSSNIPGVGNIVPLLRGPEFNSNESINQVGGKNNNEIYYLDPISSTVNDNGVINTSDTSGASYAPTSTKLTNAQLAANQLEVKNYLKDKGLSQVAAAGIMGNIERECHFNPGDSFDDVNNATSYGLIQWNGGSYDISQIPPTVEGQMDKLFDFNFTKSTKTYLDKVNADPSIDAWTAAYLFASIVERCSKCTKGVNVYRAGGTAVHKRTGKVYNVKPVNRSTYALDFMQRFADPNDPLAW